MHTPTLDYQSKPPAISDRVPFGQKLAYGIGNCTENLAIWVPMGMMYMVFNVGAGMDPILIGWVLALWRVYDAFTDPIMGNISDNTRTRWGRRRPYIVAGAILTGLFLPLMYWMPVEWISTLSATWKQPVMFGWLLVSGILLYTSFTIWAMPYYSLQLEMTPDYNERTSISAYRAFFQKIIGLAGGWFLALATSTYFFTDGKPDVVNGMRYVGILIGILIITLGVLPGLFTRERYYANTAARQKSQPLIPSLKKTLSTRPFLLLILIVMTQIFGMAIPNTLGSYLNLHYVCGGDLKLSAYYQGVINTAMFAPALLAIPFCTWFSARYGKRMMLYLVTATTALGYLSVYLFYVPGVPWLMIFPAILKGTIATGLWMIAPSMQADIADYDELQTGLRREGSFSSVFSWSTKVAWTIVMLAGGYLLAATGFDSTLKTAQPPEVMERMRHLYVWLPMLFLGLSAFAISRYGLTKSKMTEVREALEARRGAVNQ
jgi:glycoside/pentoside/hexuronide:cation symporter, GPH family